MDFIVVISDADFIVKGENISQKGKENFKVGFMNGYNVTLIVAICVRHFNANVDGGRGRMGQTILCDGDV